jgi:3-keto-disaccharide hydrolase/FG-GAP-like repeat
MRKSLPSYRPLIAAAAVVAMAAAPGAQTGDPPDFKADGIFKGSALTGWRVVGQADWKAENGELVGRAKSDAGGWLLMEKSFQDLQFFANLRCQSPCQAGVLLRAEKTADGGMRGIYVSFADGDFASYRVTLDGQGQETNRSRIGPPPAPGSGAATAAAAAAMKAGTWNPIKINLWGDTVRAWPGIVGPLADQPTASYGPVALYVGGTGEVRYKDVAWKDINSVVLPEETVSSRFTIHRLNEMYYGWSAATSDINRDGAVDIVSGPFYYLGPKFIERKIYRMDRVHNPATEYAPDMVNFTYDYTGDGWPDILASGWDRKLGTRPIDLYVNPKGESRRWDHTTVLPTPNSESVLMRDIDGDGKPDMIFGTADGYGWAKPDPANPTAPWVVHNVAAPGQKGNIHGLGGIGDVNGDGKADVVVISGWYEQPAGGATVKPWTFHPATFGTASTEMGVYDVNGDGLTDVVSSLSVHGWGLAWFEQKRAADGTRTFVQHAIATDYSTKNAGDVVFSEAHAARFVDMTGDKIPDFIVGKRYWSHLETYNGPDPYGPAVIYIYRTVRNPKAEGGAEFVPELVHNRSGVGSAFEVADINKDGRPDIAVAGAYGTQVFLSK